MLSKKSKLRAFTDFLSSAFHSLYSALGFSAKEAQDCFERYLKGQRQYGIGNWIAGEKYRGWVEVVEEAADGVNISLMEQLRSGEDAKLKLAGLFGRAYLLGRGSDIPLLVYISHPYSDNPEANIEQVKKIAIEVMKRGHIPVPVHLMFHEFDRRTKGRLDEEVFLEADLWLLNLCDVVLIAGISPGVLVEFAHAVRLGKKIINSPEELPKRRWKGRLLKQYIH
ncbi:MAG: hypothetical protein JRD89_00485 [Deltaproteobacteria bacterium]|nr:hypothetical protein [Deltaproteobacteria bacterium]